jgi:hypothetical protein
VVSVSGSRHSVSSNTYASLTEKNMIEIITLTLVGLVLAFIGLLWMFIDFTRSLWSKAWGGQNNASMATERYARANWWCPARRNRSAATGVSGFNLSIFPIRTQWRHRLMAWLFPHYFWMSLDRHGRCLGSGCAVWRWHERNPPLGGWCGLADRPLDPRVKDLDIHPFPWLILASVVLAVLFLLIIAG